MGPKDILCQMWVPDPQGRGDFGGQTSNQNMQLQIVAAPWRIERKRFRLIRDHLGYLLTAVMVQRLVFRHRHLRRTL